MRFVGADCATEPVTVESLKLRPPRLEQPVNPIAAIMTPATATALLWVRGKTRLRIGLLVRRYTTTRLDATPAR